MNALNSAPQAPSPLSRAGNTRAQWPARLGVALSAVTLAVLAGCANLGNSHSTQTLTTPGQLASAQLRIVELIDPVLRRPLAAF